MKQVPRAAIEGAPPPSPSPREFRPKADGDRALAAAAGLLALYLAVAVPWALGRAGIEVYRAADARESLTEGRARISGESYTRAIDEIRRALPAGEGYLLVEGGSPNSGGAYWVRYDLAPRRAVYLGRLDELTSADQVRRRLTANLRHVVVTFDTGQPPQLYERYRFLREIDRRAGAAPRAPARGRPAQPGASRSPGVPGPSGR
jgi:hypothetical protein